MTQHREGRRAARLCAALALVAVSAASAQPFPSKPIRILVPYAPGGSPDVVARSVANGAAEGLGQSIVVENRPGAGGAIAGDALVRSAPDGYTVMVADSAHYAMGPHLNTKLPFDFLRDFTPITLAAYSPLFLIVNAGVPATSVREFLALAKEKPGLPVGSSGNGSTHHLGVELLRTLGGVDITHVPYKGSGQSLPAVVAGDVAAIFSALNGVLPHAKAGKIRILAVAMPNRTELQPDIPTMGEAGVPGCEMVISIGFFAPASTPKEIVARLSAEFAKALGRPEVRTRFVGVAMEVVGSSPEQYGAAIKTELATYGKLIKAAGPAFQN